MTRIGSGRIWTLLFNFFIVWSLSNTAAAVQVVTGGSSAFANGDFVTLTLQPPDATLNVLNGTNLASDNGLSSGNSVTSTPTPNNGIVNFLGNSVVTGQIGIVGQVLNFIRGGVAGTTVTFNGAVAAREIDFTAASTMVFNANTSAALHYNTFNGTAVLAPGVTYTGAATSTAANTGILTLNSGSQYIGAVGTPTFFLRQINVNANAGITGAIASQNIILGANTLTQVGSVTFPANAAITVRALSDSVYGRINAPGSAINFTTGLQVNMLVDNTVILSGVPLQVVTGTSGTFGPSSAPITTTSNNARFSFIGLNPAGTGNVLIFPTVIPAVIPPGIPPAIAPLIAVIDSLALGATGDLLTIQAELTALNNLEAIAAAAAQLAPTLNGGNAFMSFETVNRFQSFWQSNLIKNRVANMCYTSDAMCLSPCQPACDPCDPCCKPSCETAWNGEGVWIDGFGMSSRQGTRQLFPGYHAKTGGGMVGIQRPISQDWQVGVSGAYAHTNIHGKGTQRNGTKIETPAATLYLGYTCGPWFLDNFATYAWNRYKGFRHISFAAVDRTANAKYHGKEFAALISGGYNFSYRNGLTIAPLASIQYLRLRIGGYTETGADAINLIQKPQRYEVVQTGLGMMIGYPFPLDCGTLFTEVHAKWLRDVKHYHVNITSKLLGGGPFFNVRGVSPIRHQGNLGISSTFFTAGNWAITGSYECYYRTKFTNHLGRATVAYTF